ncbi:hypothetical protein [Thermoanaerobacterium sp. RBIITD]|uniref:hypothetical protein n=1 Tax=Thermoanaerobacterium sp. RBIITD TaxID=1550240 RepID=UPI000BB97BB2|nr:hypothetical protein [Thermoanaerobacterium sp. RBIITD]SNX54900.1 hypothetical protein SAMN05660242_2645 [Thermoanaerobacterium sp. RBIITD]
MDRDKEISEIVDFVERYKESMASQMVMSRILGDKSAKVDNETIAELKHHIENANDDELEACYYIIK